MTPKTTLLAIFTLIFSFGTLAVQTADARVIVKERVKYYNVSGKTGKALFKSISKRGPRLNARHAIATMTSDIKVRNLKPKTTRSRCRIASVNVILNITYRYPRWRGVKRASPKLRKAWGRFMKKVRQHEQQHGRIAKDHAKEVDSTIRRLSGRVSRNCKNFGRGAGRKFLRAAKKARKRHQRLDRRDSRVWSRNARLQRTLYKAR